MSRSLIIAIIFSLFTGCALVSREDHSNNVFVAGMMLLSLHDNDEKLSCVDDPALYLRILRPHLEDEQVRLKSYLLSKHPSPSQCLDSCSCDEWLAILSDEEVQHTYSENEIEKIRLNSENQKNDQCIAEEKKVFCQTDLFKKLDQEKKDFLIP
ncbi:MAG: hypothetical protein K2P81_15145 [Bacteriovoracaceae bacterium]|nr:hypothetical protein [Bacteriovoracaceae bacterium]